MTRDEALKKMQAIKAYMTSGNPIWSVTEIGEAFDMAIEALGQPERKKGKWIGVTPMVDTLMCSECGYNIIDKEFKTPYCPNCGALMRGTP